MVITHKFWVITWFRISDSELELTRRQNSAHSHTSEISGIDQNDQFFKNWNNFSNLFQFLANSIGLSSNYLSVIGSQILFQFSAWWKSFFGNRFYLIFLGFYLKYLANFFNLGWDSLAPIADGHSLFLISSLTHGTSMMEVHKFDWSIWIQKIHHPLIYVWTDFVRRICSTDKRRSECDHSKKGLLFLKVWNAWNANMSQHGIRCPVVLRS